MTPGHRLGPYEILAPLGAGGMGEVYRARDTRLGRDVAVKVLPQHLSSNSDVRARFEREARTVSSLNHPHICTLHDVGREGQTDYLVMEMIEGETLAQRLARGALPLAETLRIGAQIAGALDRAHRAGVMHRDLKPGNVMLTKAGAKLMDFGLAKATGFAGAPSNLTASPTVTTPLTSQGMLVGTFQYMAPEQLEGQEADSRTDLFALGLVIYEMATGLRAFDGKTQASLIASILKEEPRSIQSIAAMSPPALDRLVRLCLRKDPDERIQSAHDVKLRLEEIAERGPEAVQTPGSAPAVRSGSREWLAWGVAALAALLLVGALARSSFVTPQVQPMVVSSIVAPEDSIFVPGILGIALSPDGRRIAYVARGPSGTALWTRPLDSGEATLLASVDDAECPFWSPDSRKVGFYSGGYLRTIEVAGGQSVALASMRSCLGASWGSDGSILFTPDRVSPVMKIPASGGEPTIVVARDAESRKNYSQPSFLPDGRHVLYTVNESWQGGTDTGIYVATVGERDEKKILPVLSNARYVPPGYLVYGKEGTLFAHRFDTGRLEVIGEPIRLFSHVQYVGLYQSHMFSVSDNGLLAYAEGKGTLTRQLTWVDRKGAILGTAGKPGNYFSPRISHDGKKLAYDQSEASTDSGDIWVFDTERDIATRLTFDSRNESSPIWSPDDRRLIFFGDFPGRSDIFSIPSDGTGVAETLLSTDLSNFPSDWSQDGKTILVQTAAASAGLSVTDLQIYSVEEKKVVPWLNTPFIERQGHFSPDGRWIAYDSDESGRMEVYVRGTSTSGGKWRVSGDGGSSSIWSRDGKELFYLSPDSTVMSVAVRPGEGFDSANPIPLFRIPGEILSLGVVTQYDVSPDGRFLMNLNTPTQGQKLITLVSSWTALLPRD